MKGFNFGFIFYVNLVLEGFVGKGGGWSFWFGSDLLMFVFFLVFIFEGEWELVLKEGSNLKEK